MFFLIGGVQPKTVIVERLARACPVCAHNDVYVKRIDQYLSLFFIPLFRVKKGKPFPVCGNCNSVLETDRGGGYYRAADEGRKCARCGRHTHDEEFFYCPYCGRRL